MTQEANGPCKGEGRGDAVRPNGEGTPTGDVLFDFGGTEGLDVMSLSILLTAHQIVERGHRRVWVAGLPAESWRYLRAMGLAGWFRQFPGDGPAEA